MKILEGGISNIEGFLSLGKNIGIKPAAYDFAVLYAEEPCNTAAVYTRSAIKGAPLQVTMEHLRDHKAQAIAVNSGIANVATGEEGLLNAKKTTQAVADVLGIKQTDVLVASTGVIGVQLPFEKIENGVKNIKNELVRKSNFSEAIMTTDTVKKEICVEVDGFKIAGAAKGAAMIEPNMATMLAFIITDAEIAADQLQMSLKNSVDQTFNMTSVDTDTSTSDMVVLMANGLVPNVDLKKFQQALSYVCLELAKMILADAEGATKLITCKVAGAKTEADAKKIAKSVINSPLVKTAVYGNDPNWGRIIMALGKSGAENISEEKIDIFINGQPVVDGGKAASTYSNQKLSDLFEKNKQIEINIDLNLGTEAAIAYGCDMSEEYVKLNSEYTT